MLLAIDVGNTHTVLGVYQGEQLLTSWRLSSEHHRTRDEWAMLIRLLCAQADIDLASVDGVVMASVVPTMTPVLEAAARDTFRAEPLVVNSAVDTGLIICYEDPRQVGADRIANAVAAYEIFGGPTIVVDFGTATTLDVISADGRYLGGIIAPGVETSASELFRRAAKLPKVELKPPQSVVGRTTEQSMQSGIVLGAACQVDGLVWRLSRELGFNPKVVGTGGLASVIAENTETIELVEPNLTLEGLRRIYARNRQR